MKTNEKNIGKWNNNKNWKNMNKQMKKFQKTIKKTYFENKHEKTKTWKIRETFGKSKWNTK